MAHAKTQVQAAKYPLPVSVNGLSKVRLNEKEREGVSSSKLVINRWNLHR